MGSELVLCHLGDLSSLGMRLGSKYTQDVYQISTVGAEEEMWTVNRLTGFLGCVWCW